MALETIELLESNDITAIRKAYRELWCAVENGDFDRESNKDASNNFFKHREQFRKLMQIWPKASNREKGLK
jgi:hypothetical protein